MIKESSFTGAIPSATALDAMGKMALPEPGTVLSELVRLSIPVVMKGQPDGADTTDVVRPIEGSVQSMAWQVQFTTEGSLEAPTQHSLEMDAYIRDISKVVVQHVAFAKNTVRPLVTEFAQSLSSYLATTKPGEASDTVNIKSLRVPAILKDESFLDTFIAYKDKPILTPEVSLSLGSKGIEELQEFIYIGHDRSDKLIAEWLSHLPEAFLLNVWNSFFCSNASPLEGQGTIALNYESIRAQNAFDKADHSLAILLLARKCASVVQESSLSLSAYNNIVSQYVDYAGTSLIDAIAKINLSIRTKTLIIDKDVRTLHVCVNAEVYGPWLEAGGTPEVILGALITDGSSSMLALIDEKSAEYLQKWNSYCTFYRTREANNSFAYTKNYIESLFSASIQTLTESENEIVAKQPNLLQTLTANAKLYIDSLRPSDITDAYSVALSLVAKIRFNYTSSYQILSDIIEASKHNPNVDVREAALIAVINYVSDYCSDQIVLS